MNALGWGVHLLNVTNEFPATPYGFGMPKPQSDISPAIGMKCYARSEAHPGNTPPEPCSAKAAIMTA